MASDTQPSQVAARLIVALLMTLVLWTGVIAAVRWPAFTADVYGVISQLIATLFIAFALEFFTSDGELWDDSLDKVSILTLIGISWAGLFACIRGLIDEPAALLSGFSAAGLLSVSILVSLALFKRAHQSTSSRGIIILVFLFPSVIMLMV